MRFINTLGLALALMIFASSCATITRGSTDTVIVRTQPAGAMVNLSNGMSALSPASFEVPRKESLVVSIFLDGFIPVEVTLNPEISSEGGVGMAGNIIAGGIIGAAVDAGSGAMYDLTPNPLDIVLVPIGSGNGYHQGPAGNWGVPNQGYNGPPQAGYYQGQDGMQEENFEGVMDQQGYGNEFAAEGMTTQQGAYGNPQQHGQPSNWGSQLPYANNGQTGTHNQQPNQPMPNNQPEAWSEQPAEGYAPTQENAPVRPPYPNTGGQSNSGGHASGQTTDNFHGLKFDN